LTREDVLRIVTNQRAQVGVQVPGPDTIEDVLRDGMAAKRLTLSALAREAGVGRDTLYAWLRRERTPLPETWQRVADVLDLADAIPAQPDPLVDAINRLALAVEALAQRGRGREHRERASHALDVAREDLEAGPAIRPPGEADGSARLDTGN
jgi:transcriptional regulator with XRE-family HTH domain